MSFAKTPRFLAAVHPELGAGTYLAQDGTVEFYGRVRAVTSPAATILDFGAGRGAWYNDEDCSYRRSLRDLRSVAAKVIGCDVDKAVLENTSVHEAVTFEPGQQLPFPDQMFDTIVSDYVFEHIEDPAWLAAELTRIIKPGGWICARTPTRWNYVSLAARLVANIAHSRVLSIVQPNRKPEDVFPTCYLLNSRSAIRKNFEPRLFENCSYVYSCTPQYHFNSMLAYRALQIVHRATPAALHGNLFVFLRRRTS